MNQYASENVITLFETLIFVICFKIVHGFHMVVTRSSAKTTNMSVLREIREYFSELATIEIKVERRNNFQIWGKVWWTRSKNWWAWGENCHPSKYNRPAHYQYDDKEQYSRHSCLRIHRIECSDDERNANVLQRVKEC